MSLDIAAIESRFWPHGSSRDVWMIVDTARERGIYGDIVNSYFEYSCLYSGDIPYDLEIVAPHLVQLEFEDKYTRALLRKSWGQSWGIFLKCDTRMERLRRHLRTFLTVRNYDGRHLLFRYYDPRVLRAYLPTCTSDELRTVYGPVKRYWTEGSRADSLLEFEFAKGKLVETPIPVMAGAVSGSPA